MCVFIPGWVIGPGIAIAFAVYLYIRHYIRSIKDELRGMKDDTYIRSLKDDRREAQLLALVGNEWCQIAIERSTNKKELIDSFHEWILNGLLIDSTPQGYEETGYTKVEARRKIYVLMEIMKYFDKDADQ